MHTAPEFTPIDICNRHNKEDRSIAAKKSQRQVPHCSDPRSQLFLFTNSNIISGRVNGLKMYCTTHFSCKYVRTSCRKRNLGPRYARFV
jgi:hypothetical protein